MTKRITIPITGNLDDIRTQLQEELGVDLSYHQLVDYLIKFYRTHNKREKPWPQTFWNDNRSVVAKQ